MAFVLRETRRWPAFLIAETEAPPPGAVGETLRHQAPREEAPRRASAGS